MYIKGIFFLKERNIGIFFLFGAWSDKVQISEPSEALPPTQDIPCLWWQKTGLPTWKLFSRGAWVPVAPGL